MDFKAKIEARLKQILETKRSFNVLYVSDNTSRLSCVRGLNAMQEFKTFYSSITDVTLTTMDSKTFTRMKPDLSAFNVVWVDNVISCAFNDTLMESMREAFDKFEPGWRDEAESLKGDQAAYDEYMKQANEYRSLTLRVVYALDEFYWDAPGGRNRTIIDAKMVSDCLSYADTIVVPNTELMVAIQQTQLVEEDKEIVVIPSFVSNFYPVHKIFLRSSGSSTVIRRPKILVKGTVIPPNVQNFIIHSTDDYDFTISTVCELDPKLEKLLIAPSKKESPVVRHIYHWANPYVNGKNVTETMAMERDAAFDFVILTSPMDIENDIYLISDTDTDAIIAVASGSVVFAQIAEAQFGKGIHLCNECGNGFAFSVKSPVQKIREMVEQRRSVAKWDEAYIAQRTLLEHRLVSDPKILAGFFHAMLGQRVSKELKTKFDEGMAKLKKADAPLKEGLSVVPGAGESAKE